MIAEKKEPRFFSQYNYFHFTFPFKLKIVCVCAHKRDERKREAFNL